MKKKLISIILLIFLNVRFYTGIIYSSGEQDSWIRTWGHPDYNWCRDMCIDSSDNIYIAVMNQNGNHYLLKYDIMGNLIWTCFLYKNPNWQITAIDADSLNNIYVVGFANIYSEAEGYIFIQKYDSSGSLLLNFTWDGENDDFCSSIAIDSLNNLYVAGGTNGIDWWTFDTFFLKFNSSGVLLFNYSWGTDHDESYQGLTIDSSDNLYLSGYSYNRDSYIGESTLIKCNPSGKFQWNQTIIGGTYTCTIDYSDNVIILATDYILTHSEFSHFLLKFNNSGTLKWNVSLEGKIRTCKDIAIDSQNKIYLTDTYIHSCCSLLSCSTCYYMILGVYNNSGGVEKERQCYRTGSYGEAIAIDSSGNLYLAGQIFPNTGKIILLKNPSEYIEPDLTLLYILIPIVISGAILCLVFVLKRKKRKILREMDNLKRDLQ